MLTNEKESACNQNVIVLVANGYADNRDYNTGFLSYLKFILGSKRSTVEKPKLVNPC